MLVLSRRRDESIVIGDDIQITVIDIRGDKVRIGIDAPTAICVYRKELHEAIQRENEQATAMQELPPVRKRA
ncbi:MAG: carbon storage regulator CsrA [Phycisphaerales bacterium]|jgi:carbon storage regulator|nr:carbon storage regulator [Planctomycetaceae bacterium]MDP6157894.1 carbon storage regulator CsrA [Phycisphaerales bacterium]MDP6310769.1 carbon storage regulator CsrA [Phycisphaerales bacterium]MDP7086397.1 carbon storage regulator CsrA [Phycisphaerales bacterium]MDP7188425.1 carbon storage regulator CsrA [Phycisphaerales bacterium]|tara:strand:+ start:2571 stop:2786 length:216 start_codon:yes stop_codon:yes gene_type:complete